jgi:HK97 gp10 family phage protein
VSAGVTIRVKFNRLGDIARELPEAAETIVDKFLTDVDADATINTPVDTGYLKNSKVREKNRIAWGADYAAYVNFGTRFMEAQPFASNAVEHALPGAEAAVADLAGRLGE